MFRFVSAALNLAALGYDSSLYNCAIRSPNALTSSFGCPNISLVRIEAVFLLS